MGMKPATSNSELPFYNYWLSRVQEI